MQQQPTSEQWLTIQQQVQLLTEQVAQLQKTVANLNQRTRSMVRIGPL